MSVFAMTKEETTRFVSALYGSLGALDILLMAVYAFILEKRSLVI